MKKVDSDPNFEIESVYGWASAELFAQALKNAGNPPTRSGLITGAQQGHLLRRRRARPAQQPGPGHSVGMLLVGPGAERCDQAGGAHAHDRVLLRLEQLPEGARLHPDDTADVVGEPGARSSERPALCGSGPQELVVR